VTAVIEAADDSANGELFQDVEAQELPLSSFPLLPEPSPSQADRLRLTSSRTGFTPPPRSTASKPSFHLPTALSRDTVKPGPGSNASKN